jgi:hypothetical protein
VRSEINHGTEAANTKYEPCSNVFSALEEHLKKTIIKDLKGIYEEDMYLFDSKGSWVFHIPK